MRKLSILMVVGFFCLGLVACGGSSGGTTAPDGVSITSIDQLPKAIGAMATSSSASISVKSVEKGEPEGIPFSSITSSAFTSESSMGGCEMFNALKEAFSGASQPDQIVCYVGEMIDSFDGSAEVDPYDGKFHVYDLELSDTEDDGSPDKIKMKISKDSDGSIILFEMFACATISDVPTQMEYVKKEVSIDANANTKTITIVSKGLHSDGEYSGSHYVSVVGETNSDNAYTSRTINIENTNSDGSSNSSSMAGTLVQNVDDPEFTFSGFQAGSYDGGTYQTQVYAAGNLVNDDVDKLEILALGDGAVKVDQEGSWTEGKGGSRAPAPFVEAWSGIPLPAAEQVETEGLSENELEDVEFYSNADAGTVAKIVDISISFGDGEKWDCSDDAEGTVSGDMELISAECDTIDHDWIDCYDIIDPDF